MTTRLKPGMTSLMLLPTLLMLMATSAPPAADRFIHDRLHLTDYRAAQVDLNGDGRSEILVYAQGHASCGSGGCDLFVLTPRGPTFAVVMKSSVTRLPIRLLRSSTHGWRDLGVGVSGGGILSGYQACMRFDGKRYPGNPTVPPAILMKGTSGTIVLW